MFATKRRRTVVAIGCVAVALAVVSSAAPTQFFVPSEALANTSPIPLLWLDSTNPTSYSGSGTTWTDLSPNGRNGTIVGNVTYDATTQAFRFPGGANGQGGYVSLAREMSNFEGGLTIEFEGEFGAVRSNWERIFDFALDLDNQAGGIANIANALWVGQFDNFNELTIEVFRDGTSAGYCYTATGNTALGAAGDRSFNKWLITIDSASPYKCRIYKNGVQLPTRATPYNSKNFNSTGANLDGSDYALPLNRPRPSTFIGRSNFSADNDLEGSIRYIRVYDSALSTQQAQQNASATVVFDANGGNGSMTNQTSTSSAALTLNLFTRYGHTFNGWNTDRNGNGVAYAEGDTYPFSSDTTLFAQWIVDPNAPATTVPVATTVPIATTVPNNVGANSGSATPTTTVNVRSTQLPQTGSNTNNSLIALAGAIVLGAGALVRFRQKSSDL